MKNTAFFLKIKGKQSGNSVLFAKLKDVYPECFHLIEDADQLFPLRCFYDDKCHRGHHCFEKLAKRVKYLFDVFDNTALLILYFTYKDAPGTHRACVFTKNMDNPRYIVFNRSAWEKLKKIGVIYQWEMPNELFLHPMETEYLK